MATIPIILLPLPNIMISNGSPNLQWSPLCEGFPFSSVSEKTNDDLETIVRHIIGTIFIWFPPLSIAVSGLECANGIREIDQTGRF